MFAIALPAFADGTADEAELHFRLGKDQYKLGAYEIALTHFFQSNRLVNNRNVLFNIAGTYEALKDYANAHRYYVDALEGETNADKRADVQKALERLAAFIAVLDVKTNPPGATLYIQRKDLGSVGVSPRPLALESGTYRVIAELEGYDPQQLEIEVVRGKRTAIDLVLAKIVGTVRAEVKGVASAEVRVDRDDGPPVCIAPCELELAPGRHDLYFTADGFQVSRLPVTVEAKRTITASTQLVSLMGTLVVRTEDRGATVKVDGKPIGFTPLVARDIPVGKRNIRIEMRGRQPFFTTVDIHANTPTELTNARLAYIEEGVALREVTAASRITESVDDAPASVTILDRQEIQAFGYPTIYEALRGVRGIAVANDRAYPTAQVRGIGQPGDYGNRFLVLSDGHSLNENVGASSQIGQDARADLVDVDRIEVIRGPGSLFYGTGAISGVVNLNMRKPDGPNEVHANVGVYDDNVMHARAGFHYNFGKNRSIWASVSAARSDGFSESIPVEDVPTPRVAKQVDAFSTIGTAGRVTLGVLTGQWYYQQRHQIVPVGAYGTIFNDPMTTIGEQRFAGEIRFEPRLGKNLMLFTRVHANHYNAPLVIATGPDGRYEETYSGTWLGAEARLMYTPRRWLRFTAGAEGQAHLRSGMQGATISATGREPYVDEQRPFSFGAVYAVAEGSPKTWFRFSAGSRVNLYATFGAVIVPRIAFIFRPRQDHIIKLMGGRAFRAPSVYEQYYNDGSFTQAVAQDPARGLSLSPESSYSGEIEYSARFLSNWNALATVHATVVNHIIELGTDTPSSEVVRYANSSTPAFVAGGDMELRREWRRGTMFGASYGFQRAQKLDPAASNPLLENAPHHLASIRFVTPILQDIASVGFRATLEAPRRISADSNDVTSTAVVADATLSGSVFDTGIRYVVGVYNLGDWHYEVPTDSTFASRTMPQNGRRFLLDLQWTLR